MKQFVEQVCGQYNLPPGVKSLTDDKRKKLTTDCTTLKQIYSILNSCARIVPSYGGKELYVLKRLDAMVAND
jgi:hypothetical protein